MERKRILVAFGDIIGFRAWTQRALTAPEDSRGLIDQVYSIFSAHALDKDLYVKYLGDGFMIVQDLKDGHNCGASIKFLKSIYRLTIEVKNVIGQHWPRPEGFRMRVASGYVWKHQAVKMTEGMKTDCHEYIGYAVNLAQALLFVNPQVPCIAHESVLAILGKKKGGLKFQSVDNPKEHPRGVDAQDLKGLTSFRCEENADVGFIKKSTAKKPRRI